MIDFPFLLHPLSYFLLNPFSLLFLFDSLLLSVDCGKVSLAEVLVVLQFNLALDLLLPECEFMGDGLLLGLDCLVVFALGLLLGLDVGHELFALLFEDCFLLVLLKFGQLFLVLLELLVFLLFLL